jgi:hypothetical protein
MENVTYHVEQGTGDVLGSDFGMDSDGILQSIQTQGMVQTTQDKASHMQDDSTPQTHHTTKTHTTKHSCNLVKRIIT